RARPAIAGHLTLLGGRGGPMTWKWSARSAGVLAGAFLLLPGSTPAATGAQPGWWSYDRPATYETVKTNVFVLMRDATPIHCVVSQPGRDGVALAGPFPSLIT